jgi:hypothetical protein
MQRLAYETLALDRTARAHSRAMNLVFAIPLLLALGCVLYLGRRMARRRVLRRAKERRERNANRPARSFVPAKTKRSQMRTDDDPTTVMERITESKAPTTSRGKKPK